MAAVPSDGKMQIDPQKETIYSLPMIREMLDHAADVQEAVALMENYNLLFGGPPLHYLLADSTGRSALVEFYQSEMVVTYNEQPWQVATNFLCAPEGACNTDRCWRYDTISEWLQGTYGQLTTQQGMGLLAEVSQEGTQWSVLYGLSSGEINVAMGRDHEKVYRFYLEP
jgi:choloylglycine hydrolase